MGVRERAARERRLQGRDRCPPDGCRGRGPATHPAGVESPLPRAGDSQLARTRTAGGGPGGGCLSRGHGAAGGTRGRDCRRRPRCRGGSPGRGRCGDSRRAGPRCGRCLPTRSGPGSTARVRARSAGRALAAAGEREAAAAELERAARALDSFGARRYREEAEHELRRLGRRFGRRTRAPRPDGEGVETLTPRELEVAELVVERRTNPEIARALVLSEKTIETHMRNIFRKLGVSSRADVARAVESARPGSAPR